MEKMHHKIISKYSVYSNSEKTVAEYILKNSDEVILLSMKALAEKIGLSDNTVLRFCRTCGYSGYLDFKTALISETIIQKGSIYNHLDKENPFDKQKTIIAQNISTTITETINSQIEADIYLAAQKIAESEHNYIAGLAASYGVSLIFTDSLHLMSISCSSISDRVEIERTCLSLQNGSVMIGLTNSGETDEVITAIKRANDKNIFTILISNNVAVQQAVTPDIFLCTQVPAVNIAGSYFALPRIAQLSLIELILSKIPKYINK